MRYALAQKEVFKEAKELFKKTSAIEVTEKHFKDVKKGFLNLIIRELAQIQKQHSSRYGELIITSDYKKSNYWRKTIHPRYKESRDKPKNNKFDEVIWKNFIQDKNECSSILHELGLVILDTIQHQTTGETVEADDIIGVLTRIPGKHLIVSSDGDFDQLLRNPNIKRYNLLEARIVKISNKEINDKNQKYLVLGQSKDDIPNIKFESELSDEFIKWMKDKHNIEITKDMIHIIKEKYSSYMEDYRISMFKEDTISIASGKRKQQRKLTAYKKPGFGEVSYRKMIEKQGLDSFLNENQIYKQNYELNKQLYLLENIPQRIVEIIGREYLHAKRNITSNKYQAEKLFYENGIDILLIHEFF